MDLLLTRAERERFAAWLEYEAASDEVIIKHMEKIPGTEPMAKRMKLRMAAYRIVAMDLRSVEEVTVEG